MLVLSRNKEEVAHIGNEIAVTVLDFGPDEVAVQVDYPSDRVLRILRKANGEQETVQEAASQSGAESPKRRAKVSMKTDDVLSVGDDIRMMVLALQKSDGVLHRARLGFSAPRELPIWRSGHPRDDKAPVPHGAALQEGAKVQVAQEPPCNC